MLSGVRRPIYLRGYYPNQHCNACHNGDPHGFTWSATDCHNWDPRTLSRSRIDTLYRPNLPWLVSVKLQSRGGECEQWPAKRRGIGGLGTPLETVRAPRSSSQSLQFPWCRRRPEQGTEEHYECWDMSRLWASILSNADEMLAFFAPSTLQTQYLLGFDPSVYQSLWISITR